MAEDKDENDDENDAGNSNDTNNSDTADNSSDTTNNSDDDNSGVLASFTRTLTRSFQQLFRRVSPAAKGATKILPKQALGRLPTKQLAKLADKSSTIFDVAEAASPSSIRETYAKTGLRGLPSFMTRASATFAKNALLGTILFETYEYTIALPPPPFLSPHLLPFAAGGLAGSAHAAFASVADTSSASLSSRSLLLDPPFPLHRLGHHVLTHSILFGSFETLKRTLLGLEVTEEEVKGSSSVSLIHGSVVAFSGGVAGSLSAIASHYSEAWEVEGRVTCPQLPRPTPRALMAAFAPSALGFLAFEYAREIYSDGA